MQNAAEAIQTLTEEAAALAAKLGHLTEALQQSSSKDVISTLQHLNLYAEAVQTLQVVTTLHQDSELAKSLACSTRET